MYLHTTYMTAGSILLGFALLIVVVLVLARPFLVARPQRNRPFTPRQALLAQKEALLAHIRTLDFDQETAKIPDDVYQAQRARLVSETAAVLQKLDELAGSATQSSDLDAEIEAAVARRRSARSVVPAGDTSRPESSRRDGGFCPHCGQPTDAGDKFCAACGQPLRAHQPA